MAKIAMKVPSEEQGLIEHICMKILRMEVEKRKIPLEKVFRRPHSQSVVKLGRDLVRELELVIPLILDSVELEIAEQEISVLRIGSQLASPWGNV